MAALSLTNSNRLSLRFLIVGALALMLLVPLLFVGGVASERQSYYQEVVTNIGQSWGHEQSVMGPVLVIPVEDVLTFVDPDGQPRQRVVRSTHVVLPQTLNAKVKISHDFRKRGIYEVPVYSAAVALTGNLGAIAREEIKSAHHKVFWHEATLVIAVSDTRAIRHASATLDGEALNLQPGSNVDWLGAGVHAALPLSDDPPGDAFNVQLEIGGTGSFALAPVADQSSFSMQSTWPHPSFAGNFLPQEREITASGFSAMWKVSALARGIPKHFAAENQRADLSHLSASVGLYEPVTGYTTVDRGIKYGILFIGLTFLTALCFELVSAVRFHLIQYAVVGIALVLFYLTLLSLTEHLTFGYSYFLAASIIVLMLGWYAFSITGSRRTAAVFVLVEVALYWVLYVLLQLEDAALLMGTALLLVGLGTLMLVTRGLHREDPPAEVPGAA